MEFPRALAGALAALLPSGVLFAGAAVFFTKGRAVSALLQLLGAACLVLVALTHVAEAFNFFPWMHWGLADGAGHYLDLGSAVLGLTLFPIGYLVHALRSRADRWKPN